MALPVVNTSKYSLTLPSSNKKIKYRPFYVKEEKVLLMALEGLKNNETQEVINAITSIVDACTFGSLNVETLPIIDIEWIFVHLRMKSKGEVVTANYKCKNMVKVDDVIPAETACNTSNKVTIDLEKVKVVEDKKHTSKIMLNDDIGVVMRYPQLGMLDDFDLDKLKENSAEDGVTLMAGFIESVYTQDKVFLTKDQSPQEVIDFLDNLTEKQVEKIKTFFDTMPKVTVEAPFKCKACGYKKKIKLEGLQNFFG